MQECRQAQRSDLFAPLVKAICKATGNGEHIQTAYRNLCQENAAAFDIGEKDFDHTVRKGNHGKQQKQTGNC